MREDDPCLKGSEARLWRLIDERCRPEADVARIDQRIWDLFGDTCAVMFTDLSGFGRQSAAFGIIHFLQIIHEHRRLLLPVVERNDGVLVKIEADSLLVAFRRVDSALRCAIEMQHACQRTNHRRTPEERVLLCVGLGYGRVLRIGDHDLFGEEVNAASKLGEDVARANEILVTSAFRAAVSPAAAQAVGVTFTDAGTVVAGSERNFRVDYEHAPPG